jgi:hypothetical protein
MLDEALLIAWLTIPPEELEARSPIPLHILASKEDVHRSFAETMFDEDFLMKPVQLDELIVACRPICGIKLNGSGPSSRSSTSAPMPSPHSGALPDHRRGTERGGHRR